jgi:hypothetical protein
MKKFLTILSTASFLFASMANANPDSSWNEWGDTSWSYDSTTKTIAKTDTAKAVSSNDSGKTKTATITPIKKDSGFVAKPNTPTAIDSQTAVDTSKAKKLAAKTEKKDSVKTIDTKRTVLKNKEDTAKTSFTVNLPAPTDSGLIKKTSTTGTLVNPPQKDSCVKKEKNVIATPVKNRLASMPGIYKRNGCTTIIKVVISLPIEETTSKESAALKDLLNWLIGNGFFPCGKNLKENVEIGVGKIKTINAADEEVESFSFFYQLKKTTGMSGFSDKNNPAAVLNEFKTIFTPEMLATR